MKSSTLHSLITARALLDDAVRLTLSDDRHLCTAGLIVLQDALELIFLALLTEKGLDEEKNLESKSFDELVGELRKSGLQVPRTGTLKALNKQRVISKHYGQLAEPVTVRNYVDVALAAVSAVVPAVLGKSLQEIFLTELLNDGEARTFLSEAALLIDKERFLDALIEIRKAIYVEIESEYAIHNWRDDEPGQGYGLLAIGKGGLKAHYWTRNREWIAKNVKNPIDYIQVDHEKLRFDAMEWGVHTSDLENIRRLTPEVFRPEKDKPWHIQYDLQFPPNQANKSNANYCLDRAIAVLLRKQQHTRARRWPSREQAFDPPPIYLGAKVYSMASTESDVVHTITEDYEYITHRVVSGFNPSEKYYDIGGSKPDPESPLGRGWISGFLLVQDETG